MAVYRSEWILPTSFAQHEFAQTLKYKRLQIGGLLSQSPGNGLGNDVEFDDRRLVGSALDFHISGGRQYMQAARSRSQLVQMRSSGNGGFEAMRLVKFRSPASAARVPFQTGS